MSFSNLGSGLFLVEFEVAEEAERVLRRGIQRFEDKLFHLERWGPEVGCFRVRVHINQCWVRVVGLPIHFWSQEVFRKLGDSYGGFVAMDNNTTNFEQLQWAKLLVRTEGKDLPESLQLVVGSSCFAIQLWWEVPPWVSVVVSSQGKERSKVRDEGEVESRVGSSVGQSQVQAQAQRDGAVGPSDEGRARQVDVGFDLHNLGMVGGTETVAGNDGKGKVVVEESGVFSVDGERLSGKGSRPRVVWVEFDNERSNLVLGA